MNEKYKHKLIEKYILMFGNLNIKPSRKLLYHKKQIYDIVIHYIFKLESNMEKKE
jgi:hypothetical protein